MNTVFRFLVVDLLVFWNVLTSLSLSLARSLFAICLFPTGSSSSDGMLRFTMFYILWYNMIIRLAQPGNFSFCVRTCIYISIVVSSLSPPQKKKKKHHTKNRHLQTCLICLLSTISFVLCLNISITVFFAESKYIPAVKYLRT